MSPSDPIDMPTAIFFRLYHMYGKGLYLDNGKLTLVDDNLDVVYRDDGVTIGDIEQLIHISDDYLICQPPLGR
jgi:hypothetical protein